MVGELPGQKAAERSEPRPAQREKPQRLRERGYLKLNTPMNKSPDFHIWHLAIDTQF
jgi:hypothetical protein